MDNILSKYESELLEWYGGPEYVRHKHRDALEAWLNEPCKGSERRYKRPYKKPHTEPYKKRLSAWDQFCNSIN